MNRSSIIGASDLELEPPDGATLPAASPDIQHLLSIVK